MALKKSTTKKSTNKPKIKGPSDAAAFVNSLRKDRKTLSILKKGWDSVIKEGKKKGYKFTRQELRDHLKKHLNITSAQNEDIPDTCICV